MWGDKRPNVFILEYFNCTWVVRLGKWERWEVGQVEKVEKVTGW